VELNLSPSQVRRKEKLEHKLHTFIFHFSFLGLGKYYELGRDLRLFKKKSSSNKELITCLF